MTANDSYEVTKFSKVRRYCSGLPSAAESWRSADSDSDFYSAQDPCKGYLRQSSNRRHLERGTHLSCSVCCGGPSGVYTNDICPA